MTDRGLDGPVNAASPAPVSNFEYTRVLARILKRPALLKVPRFGSRLLLGRDGVRELAFADQRVQPERLLAAGHVFRQARLATLWRTCSERPPTPRPWENRYDHRSASAPVALAVVAVVGGLAASSLRAVYAGLEQPPWAPPSCCSVRCGRCRTS
ncbi:DUF1731 domain-containing protein [Amycolatopsis sp. NPDC088138]|uniref:DUF1731 domain-containing protein n=1 Tax=Amycolatopsis sp. NPDC088138 TaxID=3363938 RepID=UPI0038020744